MKRLKIYILTVLLLCLTLQLKAANVARNATSVKTSGDYSTTYNGWKAIDGAININSRWISNGIATQPWLALDLGANYAITSVKLFHASYVGEPSASNTVAYRIESGTTIDGPWTTVTTYNNPSLQNITISNVNVTTRFIRLYIIDPGADNYARIPEFEVEGTTTGGGGTNLARTAVNVATSGDYNSSYSGSKAIDGIININSRWISNGTVTLPWVALDLGSNCSITRFVLYHASYVGEPQQSNAVSYRIESGSSITGPWTTITTYNNASLQNVTTSNVNTTARFVRLYITDPGADNYARIPEFEVYGTSTTTGVPTNLQRSLPACGNAGYTLNFSWTGSGGDWWIDISSDPNFAISNTYHKQITNVSSTTSADFCIMQYNCNNRLTLQPNTTYHWRIWNGATHVNGPSFSVPPCGGSCPGLYGIHWWTSSASSIMNGKRGWTVEIIDTDGSINALDGLLSSIRSQGVFEPIIRINKSIQPYGGVIPGNVADYPAFASKCADFALHLFNNYQVKHVIIGNEPNQVYENQLGQSTGKGNAAEDYAECFIKCYSAIKAKAPQVKVHVAAPGNWSATGPILRGGSTGDINSYYDRYWKHVVTKVGNNCDGYAIHTYGKHTEGPDNNLLPQYSSIPNAWGFDSYKVLMKILSENSFAKTKIVHITETNTFHGYTDQFGTDAPATSYTSGWLQQSFNKINSWYNTVGNQKIYSLCWFVYGDYGGWNKFRMDNPEGNMSIARNDLNSITSSTNYLAGCISGGRMESLTEDQKNSEETHSTLTLHKFYPLPASEKVHIEISNTLKNDIKVEIRNVWGNDFTSSTIRSKGERSEIEIDISLLKSGLYLMNVSNGKNHIIKKLIVK